MRAELRRPCVSLGDVSYRLTVRCGQNAATKRASPCSLTTSQSHCYRRSRSRVYRFLDRAEVPLALAR
jgi:hypothetical protein